MRVFFFVKNAVASLRCFLFGVLSANSSALGSPAALEVPWPSGGFLPNTFLGCMAKPGFPFTSLVVWLVIRTLALHLMLIIDVFFLKVAVAFCDVSVCLSELCPKGLSRLYADEPQPIFVWFA